MLHGAMSALLEPGFDSDRHRRDLLAETDTLLTSVEELRLADQPMVPASLKLAIRALQVRLGGPQTGNPRSLRAAQNLVFAVQQRLMAANPTNPSPLPHPGRGRGVPLRTSLPSGGLWKYLALPPRPLQAGPSAEKAWRELVALTVERAFDRWCYAQAQAARAAARRCHAIRAVSAAGAAWANYWDLLEEARRLGVREAAGSAAVRPSVAPATGEPKPPRTRGTR